MREAAFIAGTPSGTFAATGLFGAGAQYERCREFTDPRSLFLRTLGNKHTGKRGGGQRDTCQQVDGKPEALRAT